MEKVYERKFSDMEKYENLRKVLTYAKLLETYLFLYSIGEVARLKEIRDYSRRVVVLLPDVEAEIDLTPVSKVLTKALVVISRA